MIVLAAKRNVKKTNELNESFFPNVAYVNLSVLVPPNAPTRAESMITVDPNVEFTIDSLIEKFELFPSEYTILLSISYTFSDDSLLFQDDFFEYSNFLMYRYHTSPEGNYYPMRKKYKSTYYAAITTACGAKYTLFKIEGNSVSRDFLKHKFVASESQWKNFHSNFVEIITLE